MTYVYLGLGANIQPHASLQAGVAELTKTFGNVQRSSVYIAQAVGMDGPDFLNMVVAFECPMNHPQLMAWIRATETKHGRRGTLAYSSTKSPNSNKSISRPWLVGL